MRETLVYLTHLNYDDTENIMLEKLQYQVDGSQWSWHNLNKLCWVRAAPKDTRKVQTLAPGALTNARARSRSRAYKMWRFHPL
eukprot:4177960-Pleurochrysis_carterae.AAC.1